MLQRRGIGEAARHHSHAPSLTRGCPWERTSRRCPQVRLGRASGYRWFPPLSYHHRTQLPREECRAELLEVASVPEPYLCPALPPPWPTSSRATPVRRMERDKAHR